MIQVPVLTYHANNINGMDYQTNDHIALENDLVLFHELGIKVISMDQLMAWYFGEVDDSEVSKAVVLTCDDGTWFDYHDLNHPVYGEQISFFNILKNHQQLTNDYVHMTNFVIVSPKARKVLDMKCLIGKDWWQDEWWATAQKSGLMSIENHSWDHNHGVLENTNINDDTFRCIDSLSACDRQIKQAQSYLQEHIGDNYHAKYFAYPYGNYSQYLRYEYLPLYGPSMKLKAAFTTEPKHLSKLSKKWALPRYVCNNDWHNKEQLTKILINEH